MQQVKVVGFDLEGPLSPMDFAYESMGLFRVKVDGKEYSGQDVFEAVSRWDDLLTLDKENKVPGHIPDYEPGDTLSWILPHLIYHQIREDDLKKLSDTAGLVKGAKELIATLRSEGVKVGIISTSYEQHARNIAQRLGVDQENVFCTAFPLGKLQEDLEGKNLSLIPEFEKRVLKECYPIEGKDEKIREICDQFYLRDLPRLGINPREMVRVMGGTRKVEGVNSLAEKYGVRLPEMVVIGDSITDINMVRVVREAGGLAVVWNGNLLILPEGNVGLAGTDMRDLGSLVYEFWKNGLEGARGFSVSYEHQSFQATKEGAPLGELLREGKFQWLLGKTAEELGKVAQLHKETRAIVRKDAAKLG